MKARNGSTAIHLICKGIVSRNYVKLGNLSNVYHNQHPFRFLFLEFHSVSNRDVAVSSRKRRFYLSRIDKIEDAILSFREMMRMKQQPSVHVFTKLLGIIVKMKHYSVAISMFDEMLKRNALVNEYTMNTVINCYALTKQVDYGFAILGKFFKCGHEPRVCTFNVLIKGLFLKDKVPEAMELFKKLMREEVCHPNEIMCLTVINGLCKAGHTLIARDLLEELENGQCKPNVYAYTAVIDCLCKDRMVDDARNLLFKMISKGITPTVITYNSMIQGLCNSGRWKEAKDLLHEMVTHKISFDVFTFNILVDSFCKEGMVQEAEDVLDTMKERNVRPDVVTYNTLIDGYCLRGEVRKAKEIINSFKDRGLKPNIITYTSLINGYCKMAKLDEAWHLFLKIPREGLEPTAVTYNTMLHGLLRGDRFDAGLKLFTEMRSLKVVPDLVTYSILLGGLFKNQKIAEAVSLLSTMRDEGISPDVATYSIIIDGLCKNGKFNIARYIFNELLSQGHLSQGLLSQGPKPGVKIFTVMIRALCEQGLLEEANNLLARMKKSDCLPNSITYNIFVQGLLKRDEHDMAHTMLDEMVAMGFSADSNTITMILDNHMLLDRYRKLCQR